MKKSIREKIYKHMEGKCGYCGTDILYKEMQVDHIISQRNFESCIMNKWRVPDFLKHLQINDVNNIDNLICSCRSCNNYKTSMYLEEFRNEIGNQIERLKLRSVNFRLALRFGLVKETKNKVSFYFEK